MLGSAVTIAEATGGSVDGTCTPRQIEEAVAVARSVEHVVLFVGESGKLSGEAQSRTCLGLPGNQLQLVESVCAANPNTVCVIISGRPLVLSKVEKLVPALVVGWQGGTMAGGGIADVLFGKHNPSAKLTMTFPRATGQVPIYYDQLATGRPRPDDDDLFYLSGWNDCDHTPLYPFGYGLSYTRFEYGPVSIATEQSSAGAHITLSCTLTNTGKRAGHEIAQLYIRDHVGTRARPLKQLRGFEKVFLQPGESTEVSFSLTEEDLAYWIDADTFSAEEGMFSAFIGGSSTTQNGIDFKVN
jgi:beta-glucosidase